jgi:hypothetical protein
MINFFRKIRHNLLNENKTGKYIKYAVGEILLVVIGILIALQINNWNEDRKTRAFEKEMLNDIQKGVEVNIWQLQLAIKGCEKAINSCNIVLRQLENKVEYNDSLIQHFSRVIRWFRPTVANNGYESLKSYGNHLIRNDSIRDLLVIYDTEWIQVLNDRQEQFMNITAAPTMAKLFKSQSANGEMEPFDYSELLFSREYYNIVNTIKDNRVGQIEWYEYWLETMEELSLKIKKELKN